MTPEEALVIRKAKDNLDAAELLIGQGFVEINDVIRWAREFYQAVENYLP